MERLGSPAGLIASGEAPTYQRGHEFVASVLLKLIGVAAGNMSAMHDRQFGTSITRHEC